MSLASLNSEEKRLKEADTESQDRPSGNIILCYVRDTPHWDILARELNIPESVVEPFTLARITGESITHSLDVFALEHVLLLQPWILGASPDKAPPNRTELLHTALLRTRVFRFGRQVDHETLYNLDTLNPNQPYAEVFWKNNLPIGPPRIVLAGIPATRFVLETKLLAPGLALISQVSIEAFTTTKPRVLSRVEFLHQAFVAVERMIREPKKRKGKNLTQRKFEVRRLADLMGITSATLYGYYKRYAGSESEIRKHFDEVKGKKSA